MLFGLPWWAIIAIVAIAGGMILSYKEKELKMEEKRYTSAKESQELRKLIVNLKSRIENLEAIITENDDNSKSEIPLDEIEINDEPDGNSKSKVRG